MALASTATGDNMIVCVVRAYIILIRYVVKIYFVVLLVVAGLIFLGLLRS